MKTDKIQVLPELIANKIAAGEVIERPSSIVKELVENALDAGATSIEVNIKHGGRSLIRVADNGQGMSARDAETAFKRHATSKLSNADDLDRIGSFGFRGEALTSIAAVSRTKLSTRIASDASGTEVSVEGGVSKGVRQCPCSVGTIVEVRDLFFNTPARRKFLRTDPTETGHIVDAVSYIAYSRPDVRFALKSGQKTVFDLPPGSDFETRAEVILGADVGPHLLSLDAEANGIRIQGVIGKPYVVRGNRTGQVFFINGRWVKAYSLGYGLEAGYHGLLMHGQSPVGLILIHLDLQKVDVNVHPTKQEVRLSNESEVKSLLKKVIAECLLEAGDLSPSLHAPRAGDAAAPAIASAHSPYEPSFAGRSSSGGMTDSGFQKSMKIAEPRIYESPQTDDKAEAIQVRDKLGITKILGQIHNTFIVVETDAGLMIIDQHAAHERVMFEAILKNMDSDKPQKQSLLMEEVLDLHSRQVEIMRGAMEMLGKMGFEIEPFGETSFVVRTYPSFLGDVDPVSFLKNFIEEKEAGKVNTKLEGAREDVAALIACKRKSVKAHDVLGIAEIRSLLERLAVCENPFSCPHGRPAFFKQSFSDLEKHFKRK